MGGVPESRAVWDRTDSAGALSMVERARRMIYPVGTGLSGGAWAGCPELAGVASWTMYERYLHPCSVVKSVHLWVEHGQS
jgi:hypothetical protein